MTAPDRLERGVAREVTEILVYGSQATHRYTQDSPVLADVWIAYGKHPGQPQDVLLTPHFGSSAGQVARRLRERIRDDAQIAYNQVYVAASLTLAELVAHVLPVTKWWGWTWPGERPPADVLADMQNDLLIALGAAHAATSEYESTVAVDRQQEVLARVPAELPWFCRVVGTLAAAEDGRSIAVPEQVPAPRELLEETERLVAGADEAPRGDTGDWWVWSVNLNREATTAVHRSRQAIKADAAERLFDVDSSSIAWAVIDSGIDARHPAFRRRDRDARAPLAKRTRVRATYDFTRIRLLLDPMRVAQDPAARAVAERMEGNALEDLKSHLLRGRAIDWAMLAPFLEVPMTDEGYDPPRDGHGTHVAGILGADWEPEPRWRVQGVCPEIELYDMRVVNAAGDSNDEFAVLAALQFVRWLNSQKDFYAVHGVNLSLSIKHEVANFACGRTPVCDQCEELVASGVVVVAAAGNLGYLKYLTRSVAQDPVALEGYHTVSITDPGNAESVITVGSTHRFQPHTYGVSYFSSRGPTGDGRLKPDLVAPGEKIYSAHLNGAGKALDGTSMAAPHVSGAAAMLMARHSELVGDPMRIKQVLCDTATNLGREPYFQGSGMLDILRALQAI